MMGSVEFYENVSRLQEVIEASEDRRLDLNRQFISALKSDVIKDKKNISQLQVYWKQICDNETRSRDRNAKLLEDIDRIERNMGALARKTERLRGMKKQYEEYVERLYPDWRDQLQAQIIQQVSPEPQTTPVQAHPVRDSPPHRVSSTPPAVMDTRARSVDSPMHVLKYSASTDSGPTEVPPLQLSALRSTSSNERRTVSDFPTLMTTNDSTVVRGEEGSLMPPTGKSDITAITPITGKPSLDSKREQRVSFDISSLKKVWDSDEEDDEEVEFEITQESTPRPRQVIKVEVQNHAVPPGIESPSNGLKSVGSPTRSSQELNLSVERAESFATGPYDPPLLTITGLFHLIQFVEEEIKNLHSSSSRRSPMFYRSSTPKDSVSDEVISLGNAGRDPDHLNPVSISMVIAEQLPAIIATLPQASLLGDVIIMDFINSEEKLGEDYILSKLPNSKLTIWNRLLSHFKALVYFQTMKPQEIAELFAASLIHYNSRLENKAIELLALILEDCAVAESVTEDSVSMVTPRASLLPSVSIAKREPNQLGDSLMATAGSFHDTTPLKLTRNPDLRSTESDQQLLFLRNALRAKAESDDEEEDDDDEDDDNGAGNWKSSVAKENDDVSSEFDVLESASAKPSAFLTSSVQSPSASAALKDSDAYQKMLGKAPSNRKLSTNSSDSDDLDMMLSGPVNRNSLPVVREGDSGGLSDSGERTADTVKSQSSTVHKPISTQELLQAVLPKDDDDLDIESPAKSWNSSQSKSKDNAVDVDYDDDFDDFYK